MLTETARAKINLNLHVGRVIDDPAHPHHGYHPLSSLVAFANYGDELGCVVADETRLHISGPFAKGLEANNSNLVLQAYNAVAKCADIPALQFSLTKNLPIASGIGGGSADAAAALRLLQKFAELPDEDWREIAISLGADVPVCLHSKTCLMTGIGDDIEILGLDEKLPAVLLNPNVAISTACVFQRFDHEVQKSSLMADEAMSQPSGSLRECMKNGRNDLQWVATMLEPMVFDCLEELENSGATASRMSGSGATCFGVFESRLEAEEIAGKIAQRFPNWWIKPVMLGDPV